MNRTALILATVIFLMFPCAAMADEPGKILDRLPETVEDLEQYEGIEIPLDEAVENIVQLRNMDELYDDVKIKLLCRAYIDKRKYEIYRIELKSFKRPFKDMYLLMYDGEKKYPKALKIYSEEDSTCRRHFYIKDNIIEINYIYFPFDSPILYNEFYNLNKFNIIKSSLKDWDFILRPASDEFND